MARVKHSDPFFVVAVNAMDQAIAPMDAGADPGEHRRLVELRDDYRRASIPDVARLENQCERYARLKRYDQILEVLEHGVRALVSSAKKT